MRVLLLYISLTIIVISIYSCSFNKKSLDSQCYQELTSLEEMKYWTLAKNCIYVDFLIEEKWKVCNQHKKIYYYDKELFNVLKYSSCLKGTSYKDLILTIGEASIQKTTRGVTEYTYNFDVNCSKECYRIEFFVDSLNTIKYLSTSGPPIYLH